jgi:hypothetical protein
MDIKKLQGAWGYEVDSRDFVDRIRGYTKTSTEIAQTIAEYETTAHEKLSVRERAIFQFGFLYGQRQELREQNIKK